MKKNDSEPQTCTHLSVQIMKKTKFVIAGYKEWESSLEGLLACVLLLKLRVFGFEC